MLPVSVARGLRGGRSFFTRAGLLPVWWAGMAGLVRGAGSRGPVTFPVLCVVGLGSGCLWARPASWSVLLLSVSPPLPEPWGRGPGWAGFREQRHPLLSHPPAALLCSAPRTGLLGIALGVGRLSAASYCLTRKCQDAFFSPEN